MIDVVIVGAGPTGLFLACELERLGIAPLVIEALPAPTGLSKALGLGGRALDLLDARGMLDMFTSDIPNAPNRAALFHFGGVPIDTGRLPGAPPRFVNLMQAEIERRLEAYATTRVEIRRGVTVRGITTTDEAAVVECEGETITARFVVGCDGARSIVRKSAAIDFVGTGATQLLRLGDVKLAPDAATASGWEGRRPPIVPLEGGYVRIITKEPIPPGFDRASPLTLDELSESIARAFGARMPIVEARWLSRFTDATRLAAQFRKGRVLIAGDAAHVQLPAGGPGISLGLHDAINLGWKLATELRGHAPTELLGSYHVERHAACARVLRGTRVQGAMMKPTEDSLALREFIRELAADPVVLRKLVDMQLGLDLRYDLGDSDDTIGRFVDPELRLGSTRAVELLRSARGVLALPPDDPRAAAAKRFTNLDIVVAERALLIRPDGIVAWNGDPATFDTTLTRWFAEPAP